MDTIDVMPVFDSKAKLQQHTADDENPVEYLEDDPGRANYRQVVQHFPELINNNANRVRPDAMQWRLQRTKTIRTLNELRKKLDSVCVVANYGKGAGSGAQISGAVTAIIGAVMALGKSPSAATVMNVGNLINHSGVLVGGLSNVVESYASAGYLREVKAILDEDKELSGPLQEWLVFSRNLDRNMQIIFGSDLNAADQSNVLKVFSEFATLYKSTKGFHATLDIMNKGQYAMHIGTDIKIDKLLQFSKGLDISPQLADTIVKLSDSVKFLQVARDGVKVCQNLFGESVSAGESLQTNQMSVVSANDGAMNTIQNDGTVVLDSNNTSFQAACPLVKAVSAFCAFQAIDIASSVVSLISAATVIKNGKSKFSDAIKQLSDILGAELRSMDELN